MTYLQAIGALAGWVGVCFAAGYLFARSDRRLRP